MRVELAPSTPTDHEPPNLLRPLSHVYIERGVRAHPRTQAILAKLPQATQIEIDDYRAFFMRAGQDWALQRQSRKLILAQKRDGFLYPGSELTPNFGQQNFYYNTIALNCIYDCEYCYLQGMLPSANIVFFVNAEDYFSHTVAKLKVLGQMYLCISYDTDLLALDFLSGYVSEWLEFCRQQPSLCIELRTKSTAISALRATPACENVVLAWTLSPQAIIDAYEHKTPSLKARLGAAREAAQSGWRIRLCIDPILRVPNWQELYQELVRQSFVSLPEGSIGEVSLGTLRMNREYLDTARARRPDSRLLRFSEHTHGRSSGYAPEHTGEMLQQLRSYVGEYLPAERIFCLG
jgi:spore photoproduct lyase